MPDTVPEAFSKQRLSWLAGISRKAVDDLVDAGSITLVGPFNQVPRADAEAILGRPITDEDWRNTGRMVA